VKRLSHAHEDDVEAPIEHAELAGQYADLPRDFSRREAAVQAHFSRQAERAFHRVSDLLGDAEGLGGRVRNEDRLDVFAVRKAQQNFVVPSIDRSCRSTGVVTRKPAARCARSSRAGRSSAQNQ
jgi:hypothetical protein